MARSVSKVQVWNRALQRVFQTELVESEDEDTVAAASCRIHWDDVVREVLEARQWAWAIRHTTLSAVTTQAVTVAYASVVDTAKKRVPFSFDFVDSSQVVVVHIDGSAVETTLVQGTGYTVTAPVPSEGTGAEIALTSALIAGESVKVTVTTSRIGWEHVYPLPADCVTPTGLLYQNARLAQTAAESRAQFEVLPDDAGSWFLLCCDLAADEFSLEYVSLMSYVGAWPSAFVSCVAWRLAEELAYALPKSTQLAGYCHQKYMGALRDAMANADNARHTRPEPLTPTLVARG